MSAILEQLELNYTFFIQFAIFAVLFFFLSKTYFTPFFRLLEVRHARTVEDQESAKKLAAQAEAKFEEYKQRLAAERAAAKQEYEAAIAAARKEESASLAQAREDARKITQEAADSIAKQRDHLKQQLETDVEAFARAISERLLSRKV